MKDPNEFGIWPVSLFRSKCKEVRLGNWESELGIGPKRLLNERCRFSRFLSWAKKGGIGPETLVHVKLEGLQIREVTNGGRDLA